MNELSEAFRLLNRFCRRHDIGAADLKVTLDFKDASQGDRVRWALRRDFANMATLSGDENPAHDPDQLYGIKFEIK